MLFQPILNDTYHHVGRLKFLDSMQFLQSSMQFLSHGLNKLAEQLSNDQFKHLKADYPEYWKLLSKKGIYCYDYMNSKEWFDETSLPSKEQILTSCRISMFRRSSNTMKDYHCLVTGTTTTMKD